MSSDDTPNWADGHIDWVVSREIYEELLAAEEADEGVHDEPGCDGEQSEESEDDTEAEEEANMADEEDVSCLQDSV
jgi:hypothetical protein